MEKPLVEALELASGFLICHLTAKHFQQMSCSGESAADSRKIGCSQRGVWRERQVGDGVDLWCVLAGQMKLALEIDLGNRDIAQGHADIFVTEQVHERGKRDAQAHHF